MQKHAETTGFRSRSDDLTGRESRRVVFAELATIAGLSIATLIAATVVSVGIARASVVDVAVGGETTLFTIALLLGLAFVAVGGFAVLPGERRTRH